MSIGATLHAARLDAGLSIDDVATATRIRGQLIRQIEADNFEPCGGAIYARGHIRSIATAVGLDPAPLVTEFNALQGAAEAVPVHEILDRPEIVQHKPTGPNWTAAMLVTAVLLAGVAFVSLFTDPDGAPPTTAATTATTAVSSPPADEPADEPTDIPIDEQPAQSQSAPAEPVQTASPAASAPSVKPAPAASSSAAPVVAFTGVRVRIAVTGAKSWVRVTDLSGARKMLYQGVLQRGTIRDFTATSKMSVTFGDAGAVALTVNGRELGAPGGRGEVVTLPFVPGDPGAG